MKSIYSLGFIFCVTFLIGNEIKNVNGAAVMSIDLGNEWMKVGVVSPGVPMEIALNKESKRKTPAVIAFRDNVRIFGEDAQTIGLRFPANSYYYLLDLLGKTIDNPIVQLYKKRFPYYEISGDPDRNTVVFKSGADTYSVEELIAQLIQKARDYAQDSTGQQITECVIIVPGFFGQSERDAMLAAAQLANVKVLQLINDYTAVALNYAIFRRKEMNETAQYYMFYDMGAAKTSAAVVSYQLVKDKFTRETTPVIQVIGVGYDRTLGGLEMQLRLRDFLAEEFNKMKKTKTNVFKNGRAMAKLFKEAGRVKNVLSANSDHYAQIEGLIEDIDFKYQVTREQFEELCKDLFERLTKPLEKALSTSGLTLDSINQVILFGGGTRVPKVQEILRDHIANDLGKNLNMDEAATMGAVYKAADLATGFKVQKFIIKDAVLFPIQVQFERETDSGDRKIVNRNLFNLMNAYPQKKVITFNKHKTDFAFNVNYAELDYLQKKEQQYLGSLNLTIIELNEIEGILEKSNADANNTESKGIKAHFVFDDSGVFSLAGIELVLEKTTIEETVNVTDAENTDDESPFSKLGSTISKLFLNDKDDDNEKIDNNKDAIPEEEIFGDEKKDEQPTQSSTNNNNDNDDNNVKSTTNKTAESINDTASTATTDVPQKSDSKPKITTVKHPIPNNVKYLYVKPLDGDRLTESKKKLIELDNIEKEITRRETALNALESYVIEAQSKIGENEYIECGTDEELEAIRKECSDISEWLYEDGSEADAKTYEKRLTNLKKLTNELYTKHWEHSERPDALKTLGKLIDGATEFLKNAKNFTKDNSEKDVFTTVEIETLAKAIRDTIEWRDTEVAEQKKLKRNEPIRLTVKLLSEKMAFLDREVKYLVNKLKIWKPKPKPITKNKNETNKVDEETIIGENFEAQEGEDDEGRPPLEGDATNKNNINNDAESIDQQIEFPEIEESESQSKDDDNLSTPRSDL